LPGLEFGEIPFDVLIDIHNFNGGKLGPETAERIKTKHTETSVVNAG
jgi:hypothetical protein